MPRLNESINEEWLSDKGRFSYDGLKRQRLNIPLVKTTEGFQTVLWPDALKAIAEGLKNVKGNEMKAIAGKLADAEAMVALKVTVINWFRVSCCLGIQLCSGTPQTPPTIPRVFFAGLSSWFGWMNHIADWC